MTSPDIVIIGSGMGGATIAAGLAGSGAKVTILEKGERLLDSPETRDARAIFQRAHFRPREMWLDKDGKPFNPGNYHVVGGNTKFYGAVHGAFPPPWSTASSSSALKTERVSSNWRGNANCPS
jgi:choline dehydrogenase-like flavoprotein